MFSSWSFPQAFHPDCWLLLLSRRIGVLILMGLLAALAAGPAVAQDLTALPAPAVNPAKVLQERTGAEDRSDPNINRPKSNADSLSLEGTVVYAISGGTVRLQAERLINRRSSGTSGSLRIELWAFLLPYGGSSQSGYKLGHTALAPLQAGASYLNISTDVPQLATLPDGTWYLSMIVTEYIGSLVNDGFSVVDWVNFSTPWSIAPSGATTVTVYELYSTSTLHYFRTSSAQEMQGIVNGSAGPGWVRTFDDFVGYEAQGGGPGNDVCRFYSFTSNSHFFTASDIECNALRSANGEWKYEGLAYRIQLPGLNGTCGSGLKPVYRIYNGRYMFHDSNHRFTTDITEVQRLSTPPGYWTYEGVAFCALSNSNTGGGAGTGGGEPGAGA